MKSNITTLEAVEAAAGVNFEAVKQALLQMPVSALDQANLYNQRKHFPYAWLKEDESTPSGFGFSSTGTLYARSYTHVGARLLLESDQKAMEAIRDFPNEYLAMTLFTKEGQQ